MTDRIGGMPGTQSSPGLSWLSLLSAALPSEASQSRIKGHRKLPRLILGWHVDGLGRPHQHLQHNAAAGVMGACRGRDVDACKAWVMVRTVSWPCMC